MCEPTSIPVAEQVTYVAPPSDITQDADGYTLHVEIPGVSKNGVELSFDDGKLTVVALRDNVERAGKIIYSDLPGAGYRRSFDLDPSIDTANISASVEQGVLTIRLQKAESSKPRKIEVSERMGRQALVAPAASVLRIDIFVPTAMIPKWTLKMLALSDARAFPFRFGLN